MPEIEVRDADVRAADVRVMARPGETVLGALSRSGYGYRVGCRRGGCGVCKVDLLAGRVDYPVLVAESVLSPRERDDGTCLSCRAVPREDVVVALRDDRLRLVAGFLHAALARRAARTAGPPPGTAEPPPGPDAPSGMTPTANRPGGRK